MFWENIKIGFEGYFKGQSSQKWALRAKYIIKGTPKLALPLILAWIG